MVTAAGLKQIRIRQRLASSSTGHQDWSPSEFSDFCLAAIRNSGANRYLSKCLDMGNRRGVLEAAEVRRLT
jgi:hypothetical protein